VHERRDCDCGCGSSWNERTARIELDNILAKVRAGVWISRRRDQATRPADAERMPTFHEYASWWLNAKARVVIGDKPIDANTQADYRWRLSVHLLPFFGTYALDEIDRRLCLRFKEEKLREAEELRRAMAAGADLRDRRGRGITPLGLSSIKKRVETLAGILDEAIEDEHIERNPARGNRMRIKAPKPARTFLEMDELVALIDAAGDQDGPMTPVLEPSIESLDGTRAEVARAVSRGMRPRDIARKLSLSKATVGYHLARLGADVPPEYQGRRAICGTLARSGIRASELCDLRVGEVRLHDPEGARFRIPDAKTEAGVREVQMSPELVEEFVPHFDRMRRARRSTEPDAYVFPNTRGGRSSRQRVAQIVGGAAARASMRLTDRRLPPLPHTTPHTLRRTYISIALLANRFDVLWVMGQVGHADSKMTMDVYAQLQQRVKRQHGRAFDRLVRQAREQLYGTASDLPQGAPEPTLGHESGHEHRLRAKRAAQPRRSDAAKPMICRTIPEWRDPDSNRGHHDFQSCGRISRIPEKVLHSGLFSPVPYRRRISANSGRLVAVWEMQAGASPNRRALGGGAPVVAGAAAWVRRRGSTRLMVAPTHRPLAERAGRRTPLRRYALPPEGRMSVPDVLASSRAPRRPCRPALTGCP
jgi:integrase